MTEILPGIPRIDFRTRRPADVIALRGVRLRSKLAGLAEKTTVEQTFVNREPQPIEAVYTFPLPEDAAVCHFEVVTGDRVLTGVVDETDRAIDKYDAAIDRGDAAYLLEQERPDVFTIRVGNINPRQAATVRVTYVRALKMVDRQIRLSFPTTVAPRYVTATGSGDPLEAQIDGDAVNPPHVLHVPYGLTIEIDVDLGANLRKIASPSHVICVEDRDDAKRRITFSGGIEEMNRDVVLSIEMKSEEKPSVQVGTARDGDNFLAVTFVPEFDTDELPAPPACETIFVLDCSGSMQGESIAQASAALELCLRSLSEGDTFNVCRFGSRYELLFTQPTPYTGESLRQALAYVHRGADLGGTELLPPLQGIFAHQPRVGAQRQIILLTDGQVSNEPAVIELARKHRGENRIFSFGIGAAASANLVKGLARATGGASEFITAGERIEDKVLRTFGRMASPRVSDVDIDFGDADVQTLAEIGPVFDGESLAVYGRALGKLPASVTLRCKTPRGAMQWSLPVGYPREDDGVIATMWARRAIQSFEEVNGVRRTSVRMREINRDRDKLIALSKQFNLLCSLTAFVAVEHRTLAERNDGQPAVRRVPVTLAQGWGDVRGYAGGEMRLCLSADVLCEMAPTGGAASAMRRGRGSKMLDCSILGSDISIDRLRDAGPPAAAGGGAWGMEAEETAPLAAVEAAIAAALHAGAIAVEFLPRNDAVHVRQFVNNARSEVSTIPLNQWPAVSAALCDAAGYDNTGGMLEVEIDGMRTKLEVTGAPVGNGEMITIVLPAPQAGVVGKVKRALHTPKVFIVMPAAVSVRELLKCQSADGSFDADACEGILDDGHRQDVAQELEILSAGVVKQLPREVLVTASALLAMQKRFAGESALWDRAHAKGRRYLANALGASPNAVKMTLDGLAKKM
jgi:Ca-activated chloride channel family protein